MRSTFAAALLMTTLFSACATPPDLTALETAVTTREARLPASLASGDFGLAVRQALTISPMLGRGTFTGTAPIPVWTSRSGRWPCRTNRLRPAASV